MPYRPTLSSTACQHVSDGLELLAKDFDERAKEAKTGPYNDNTRNHYAALYTRRAEECRVLSLQFLRGGRS
jgi:hypothetical protein